MDGCEEGILVGLVLRAVQSCNPAVLGRAVGVGKKQGAAAAELNFFCGAFRAGVGTDDSTEGRRRYSRLALGSWPFVFRSVVATRVGLPATGLSGGISWHWHWH